MSLVYDWTLSIDGVDVSGFVEASGTIDYGRQGKGTAYSTPRAVFSMLLPESNPTPSPGTFPDLAKWQTVIIHVTWDGSTQWRRFTGRIQALDYRRTRVNVTAVGNSVDYARHYAGGTNPFAPRSVEPDIERVEWLAAAAPWPLTVEGAPGRRIRQIERNTLPSPLLEQLVRIADDCNGLLLEDRLGVPHFRSRNFTFPVRYTLPHAIVESESLELSTDAGDAVTAVQVYYGEPNSVGVQNSETWFSEEVYDEVGYQINVQLDTDLRTPEGALGRAQQYLLKHDGGFYIPDATLVMSAASGGEADDLLDLQEGWPITLESLPEGWPLETIDADVVGVTEIMHPTDYLLTLHLEPSIELNDEDDSDPIYPDGSLTGYDATGTETISSKEYRWCRWDATGFVTNLYTESAMFVLLCAIAQGGDGGAYINGLFSMGGDGGDGGFINEHIDLNPGTWPVTVGDDAANDGDTVFYGTRLYRGGDGGSQTSIDGHDGGSGGGGFGDRTAGTISGTAGIGVVGQGYDGGGTGGGGTGGPGYVSPGTPGGDGPGTNVVIAGETWTFGVEVGGGGVGGWLAEGATPGQAGVLYLRYRIG